MDVFSVEQRSRCMAAIRSKGNKTTELALIQELKKSKLTGWRRGYPLLGRPDFCFPRLKIAVFVDGCFWHGCPKHFRPALKSHAYWGAKIYSNRKRDARVSRRLRGQGWKVLRVWEHDLKKKPMMVTARIRRECFTRLKEKVR